MVLGDVEEGELDGIVVKQFLDESLDGVDLDALEGLVDMEHEADAVAGLPPVLRAHEPYAVVQTSQQLVRVFLERGFPGGFPDKVAAVTLEQGRESDIPGSLAKAVVTYFGGADADDEFVGGDARRRDNPRHAAYLGVAREREVVHRVCAAAILFDRLDPHRLHRYTCAHESRLGNVVRVVDGQAPPVRLLDLDQGHRWRLRQVVEGGGGGIG